MGKSGGWWSYTSGTHGQPGKPNPNPQTPALDLDVGGASLNDSRRMPSGHHGTTRTLCPPSVLYTVSIQAVSLLLRQTTSQTPFYMTVRRHKTSPNHCRIRPVCADHGNQVPDVFHDVSVNWRPGLSPYPPSTLAPRDPSRQCFLDKGVQVLS